VAVASIVGLQQPAAEAGRHLVQRVAAGDLIDERDLRVIVSCKEISQSWGFDPSRFERVRWAICENTPSSWTTARPVALRPPKPAITPTAPSRPIVAVSTPLPASITASSEIMPLCGK